MSPNVPAVLEALLGQFGTVTTFLGEPAKRPSGDFVSVAWAGPDADAVTMPIDQAGLRRELATYDVPCQIVAWQGNTDMLACVTRCYATLDVLTANLAADRTLGGACIEARAVETGMRPNQTGAGAESILAVVVQIKHFL